MSKRKKNAKTKTEKKEIIVQQETETENSARIKEVKVLSSKQKIIFYTLMILLPLFFIGALEIGLRVFNYGPDISLFVKREINDSTFYVMNPWVRYRYFYDTKFNPEASTDYFKMPKPKGTFRIFCLGGSTAAGFPYWRNASFASFLNQRLQKVFPERKIEVINIGMTAINSFSVLDMGRELPSYEPDLIVVYDGHNEFYGGLGLASNLAISDSRWVTQLYLKMLHSRIFLLVRETVKGIKSLFGSSSTEDSRNMSLEIMSKDKYIPLGSPLYEKTKSVFKENMEELRAICTENKIPIIFSTQVSNLRDMPPFVSIESKDLTDEQKKTISNHANVAIKAWNEKRWQDARVEFKEVLKIDSQHAGAHFAIARCLSLLNRIDEARAEFIKARDCDQLRFRTSSDFNSVIKNIDDKNFAHVIDMEKFFMSQSPDSLIGNDIILEHVHPNSSGYFLMAKGFASVMKNFGLLFPREEWIRKDTISDKTLWDDRMVTEIDERIAARRTEILISGKPFQKKPLPISSINPEDTLGQIAEHVIDGTWGWLDAHQAATNYYQKKNNFENLEREFNAIININPQDVEQYITLAEFYISKGKIEKAKSILSSSLNVKQTSSAYTMMGDISLNKNEFEEAIKYYENSRSFLKSISEEVENSYNLAFAYMKVKKYDIAEPELLRILKYDPQNVKATALLLQVKSLKQKNK